MIFGKKRKDQKKCEDCGGKVVDAYSFCPHCGNSFLDPEEEQRNFGILGRDDDSDQQEESITNSFGITDKLIGSLFSSVMKSLDKQLKNQMKDFENMTDRAEVRSFPNGVRIKISGPFPGQEQNPQRKKRTAKQTHTINDSQREKMNSLPREKARTHVKRIGNKVVYELNTPGLTSVDDVFVSRLESGYEIKVIGNKKVYVNSIPITLPIHKYSIAHNKLLVEFNSLTDQ